LLAAADAQDADHRSRDGEHQEQSAEEFHLLVNTLWQSDLGETSQS
jgi:hypothetical protein